jgi:hypothetical protein
VAILGSGPARPAQPRASWSQPARRTLRAALTKGA